MTDDKKPGRCIEMKMAAASASDVHELQIFLEQLEQIDEDGEFVPRDQWQSDDPKTIDANGDEVVELIQGAFRKGLIAGWRRVVWGFDTLFRNCCDPEAETLEVHPRKPMVEIVDEPTEEGQYLAIMASRLVVFQWRAQERHANITFPEGTKFFGPLPDFEYLAKLK